MSIMDDDLGMLRKAVQALIERSPKCSNYCGRVAVGDVPDSSTHSLPSCSQCAGERLSRWWHGAALARLAELVSR